MKKMRTTISKLCAFVCAITASVSTFAVGFFAKNPQQNREITAVAETVFSTPQPELLSPSTYRQYLNLSAPNDLAVNDDYTAIADGNTIFVYDQKEDIYRKYIHEVNDAPSKNKVTKLQFDNFGNLYFLDASTYLYILDPVDLAVKETPTATATGFVCSTFVIHGNILYFTNTSGGESQISKTLLSDLKISSATTLVENLALTPTLAFYKDELYYTDGGKYLRKINPENTAEKAFVAAFSSDLLSMTISENVFYCATADGEFFAYDFLSFSDNKETSALTPVHTEQGGFSALTLLGDFVYAIKNATIKQYSLKTAAFTDFEICGASSSKTRLNNASDVCFVGNTLLIADNGNERISVYDTKTGVFKTPVESKLSAKFITGDAHSVLVANQTQTTLYDLSANNYGQPLISYDKFNGNIVGVAGVYGAYYLVTEKNYYYALTQNADGKWEWSFTKKDSTRLPTLLSCDAHGNLYVACGKNVYRYTETEFLSAKPQETEIFNALPAETKKFAIDYSGNLYAFIENSIQKFIAPTHNTGNYTEDTTYALNDVAYVYNATQDVQSFAFGIENNATYVLYKDNYLAQTPKLQLPTVKDIPTNGADDTIFNAASQSVSVVKVQKDALLVEFDFNTFKGATTFPYVDFKRAETQFSALKIGESGDYDLLAYYNADTRQYSTYLVYASSCEKLSADEYTKPYDEQKTGYLSNAISLYKFPFLHPSLSVCNMSRGAKIQLLGEFNQLERAYYYVSYTDENGAIQTGYIPQSYVTATDGEAIENLLEFGATESNTDSIWRMVYILLGFGIIGGLVDYLILRKPKD
ncbi:MAG: hypothetical protein IJX75_03400 [Clostridia bacterium]|nr:hypothetical protein [Clostridia bacterium]